VIRRQAGFHWIHAMPSLLTAAPLAVVGSHAAVDLAVGEALAALQRELGAVGGEWCCYRPSDPPVDRAALERPGGETRMLEASLIELERGAGAPLARVDRKTRRDLRQARDAGLTFAEAPEQLAEAYALHLAQSRAWRGHRPLPLELSRRLLGVGGAGTPLARLFVVRDGRGLLAATFALDHLRETLVWWSGMHKDGRARHAFPLLMWSVVEWAAARGRARVNLGASAGLDAVADFKDSLGARPFAYPVRWLDAHAAPGAGRLVHAAQGWLRRGRHRGASA
jgi:hypothetical protein